jgi:hypothetical protein
MYFILRNRVLLGLDGFIRDPQMGSQFRLFCFGLNIWIAWGDTCPDGNGYNVWFELMEVNKVL